MSQNLETLLQEQLGNALQNFLTQNGESTENSQKASQMVLPTIVAGLINRFNFKSDQLSRLYDTISHTDNAHLDTAVADAQAGKWDALLEQGKTWLPTFFGETEKVSDSLAKESGISATSAGSLLAVALPLVLAVLRSGKWDMAGLLALLSSQQTWLGALPAGLLSALGIGSVSGLSASVAGLLGGAGVATGAAALADGAAATGAAGAASGGGWGKLLIGAILAAFAIWALRACMPTESANGQGQQTSVAASQNNGNVSGSLNAASGASAASAASAVMALNNTPASAASAISASESAAVENVAASPAIDVASGAAAASNANANANTATSNTANTQQASSPATASPAASASTPAAAPSASAPATAPAVANVPAADTATAVVENGIVKFYFATGRSNVAANAAEVAVDVVKAAKEGKKLILSGFTDSTGNAAANVRLSQRRAAEVKAFLIKQGVNAAQIEVRKPENSVGGQGNNAEGRRVEVKIEG